MKKLLSALLVLALMLSLASCALAGTPVKIGATPSPHAEVLEFMKPLLAAKGFDIEIVVFNDYVMPNDAVETGELDANYFQHKPYMDDFNKNSGTHLVAAVPVHFEPMGLYPGKTKALADLKDGAIVAVPNDVTNEARALLLLEAQGLIKVAEGKGLTATKLDILDNPKKLEIYEAEAAIVPSMLADVDLAVMNGNYAQGVGLFASKDALAAEAIDSTAAETYINYLVVKEGNENSDFIKAFNECLADPSVKAFFEEKYQGSSIAAF